MKQEAIDKMKSLLVFSKATKDFWQLYDAAVADPKCDKYGADFNDDNRFTVFKVKGDVFFSAYTGYYGNSGCGTFSGLNGDLASVYFLRAISKLRREIFALMAEYSRQDAEKLSAQAAEELKNLTELVNSAKDIS